MKILMFLSNPFTHDPRVYNEARSLVMAGHSVTVLAWDRKNENTPEEENKGIKIVRVFNTRFMNLVPYDIFRLQFWWKEGYRKALELHEREDFDVLHCHNLDTLPIGVALKKKHSLPLVYDAHEIWGYMVAKDLPKWWADYYLWKEKQIIKYADKIITVNEPLKKYFTKIANIPISIIMNCKHLQGTKYEPSHNDLFTLLYIGTLGKPRFLLELIDVVKELPDVHCIIGGVGSKRDYVNALKDKCASAQNVDFVGRVPMDEVLPMTKKADAVFCLFDPKDLLTRIGLPNKVFEAMVCARPILVAKGTFSGHFVGNEKCGLVIPYTKEDLKEAIITLKNKPNLCEELGKNAFDAAIRDYNWKKQEEKLLELYVDLKK